MRYSINRSVQIAAPHAFQNLKISKNETVPHSCGAADWVPASSDFSGSTNVVITFTQTQRHSCLCGRNRKQRSASTAAQPATSRASAQRKTCVRLSRCTRRWSTPCRATNQHRAPRKTSGACKVQPWLDTEVARCGGTREAVDCLTWMPAPQVHPAPARPLVSVSAGSD